MKELRKKVMLLLGERLLEFGFKKKVLNTFVRQLDDNRIQNNRNTDIRNSNFFQTKINSIDQPAEDLAYPPDNRPR